MDPDGKKAVEVREGDPSVPANSEESKAAESSPVAAQSTVSTDAKPSDAVSDNGKASNGGSQKKSSKKKKNRKKTPSSDSSDSSDRDEASNASQDDLDSDDSGSESQDTKKKRVAKKRQNATKSKKKEATSKKQKKPAKVSSSSSSSSSGSSSSSSDSSDSDSESSNDAGADVQAKLKEQAKKIQQLQQVILQQQTQSTASYQQTGTYSQGGGAYPYTNDIYNNRGVGGGYYNHSAPPPAMMDSTRLNQAIRRTRAVINPSSSSSQVDPALLDPQLLAKDKKRRQKATRLDYKRVDQVWDNTIHNYKLQDTAQGTTDAQYDEFLFHVRRTFDWEGKYKTTYLDIKSKLLRECLRDVIGNVKGVSLVEETPKLDPNLLFLYLDDLRKHLKHLKRKTSSKGDKSDRKKEKKRIKTKCQHLKVLIKYIDKDYAEVKKSLYPLLENGLITFDLLWALWKPNTLAFTTTYGSPDQHRVFKVEVAEKLWTIMKGDFYYVEGKYFEYDGKQFGYGSMSEEMGEFRGARKITSLNCYPLQYHKNEAQIRKDLIERGKKFVSLGGVHYKSHQGMAYYKKKKAIVKVNINGRIMVDPSIHRRINPNYPISLVKPKDHDIISDDEESDEDSSNACGHDSDANSAGSGVKFVTKIFKDNKGKITAIRMPKPADDASEKFDKVESEEDEKTAAKSGNATTDDAKKIPEFTDEEYLIASPVVLGFAFAEKLWLEFTVSGVKEIQWNDTAYESLVLERKTKDIVKALVESHKYHAAESIDDVIQGKGKGLVAVLHGPPGTGKTLTAEGISELLKCPLYMVSAGELGTDSRFLESELQKILDICHAWGAILLLDEADVFLEKRNMHDLHRNALVSIFLRQLEYFQGILFLTTNRVETFDDAFQSRIHIALRYDNLEFKAKKAIFKIFIERVRVLEKIKLMPFSEEDYNDLARHQLNGRQIKNTVRTAQALAVNKGEPLAMSHIKQVLEVQENFERDLKGGLGYTDAMRSYS